MLDKVGEQLPAVATTVAGLILVFLGMVFTSWESYDATALKKIVRKYRVRAWLAFFGLIASLASAVFGLVGIWLNHSRDWVEYCGVASLLAAFVLMVVMAFIAVREI